MCFCEQWLLFILDAAFFFPFLSFSFFLVLDRAGGEELDGEAIDRARWTALQRRFQNSDEPTEQV